MSNNIAIVGTRGSGKTVFTTVLANYLSTPKDGVLLIPQSYDIAEYVQQNYAKLQRGEWLDSTNVERKLSWKLRVHDREDQEMTLLDCPGEDIQRLFAKREFENKQSGGSKKDKDLVEYLLGASKVMLLINLQDFMDESHEEENVRRRTLREYSLKEFLTALKQKDRSEHTQGQQSQSSKRDFQFLDGHVADYDHGGERASRHIAVLFTAYNQYRAHIESRFGSVPAFLSRRLPALYYEHFNGQDAPGFLVSAVAETSFNGCPKPGFRPLGLNTVIEWLVDPVRYTESRGKTKKNPQTQINQEQKKDASQPKMHEW